MRITALSLIALVTAAVLLHLQFDTDSGVGIDLAPRRAPAPRLALNDVFGNPHVLADLRGSVVLVNFWTTWCPPCIQEMPSLERAWQQFKGSDFRLLAVAMGEDSRRIGAFWHRLDKPLTFTLLPDPQNITSRGWPMFGIPVTFLIDREGCIAARVQGERDWDDPRTLAVIRGLLDEPAPALAPADPTRRIHGQSSNRCAAPRMRL